MRTPVSHTSMVATPSHHAAVRPTEPASVYFKIGSELDLPARRRCP